MMTLSKQKNFTFTSLLEDIRGSKCCIIKVRQYIITAPRNAIVFEIIHPQISKRETAKVIFVSLTPILWANDYKGNDISERDHNIFCSSGLLGTACTA